MHVRRLAAFCALLACVFALTANLSAQSNNTHGRSEVSMAVHHDISPAVRDLPNANFAKMGPPREHEVKHWPL